MNKEIGKDVSGEFLLFLERFVQSEIFENIGELTDEQKKLKHDKGYNWCMINECSRIIAVYDGRLAGSTYEIIKEAKAQHKDLRTSIRKVKTPE